MLVHKTKSSVDDMDWPKLDHEKIRLKDEHV